MHAQEQHDQREQNRRHGIPAERQNWEPLRGGAGRRPRGSGTQDCRDRDRIRLSLSAYREADDVVRPAANHVIVEGRIGFKRLPVHGDNAIPGPEAGAFNPDA